MERVIHYQRHTFLPCVIHYLTDFTGISNIYFDADHYLAHCLFSGKLGRADIVLKHLLSGFTCSATLFLCTTARRVTSVSRGGSQASWSRSSSRAPCTPPWGRVGRTWCGAACRCSCTAARASPGPTNATTTTVRCKGVSLSLPIPFPPLTPPPCLSLPLAPQYRTFP